MASRLITPVLEEILKSYPLYSQDGKGKDAVCVAIFFIGHVRWFVLEGQPEGNDTTLFTIVCGLHETEYGYTSVNEMESVKVDGSKYGVDEIFQVEQLDGFKPVKLKSIPDKIYKHSFIIWNDPKLNQPQGHYSLRLTIVSTYYE